MMRRRMGSPCSKSRRAGRTGSRQRIISSRKVLRAILIALIAADWPPTRQAGAIEGMASGKPAIPSTHSARRGRRMPEAELVFGGDGPGGPSPGYVPPAGATDASGSPHSSEARRSGVAERQGHEARALVRLHPEQQRMLSLLACVRELAADIAGARDRSAADVEDDVANLKAVIGGDAVRIDRGDDHALSIGTGSLAAGREREPELGNVAVRHLMRTLFVRSLLVVRQRTERQRHGLFLTLVEQTELDGGAGAHRADPPRQLARIVDRRAVHRGDDVTALDSGIGRGTLMLRLGHQSAGGLLQSEAVGEVRGDRLYLHADPAAGDAALIAQLPDDALDRIGRDGEGDTDRTAGGREDRRVDADDVAIDVEGRATGIALVDRRVDLDEVVIGAGADIAAAGRDDAGRDSAAKSERIADREHPVADARRILAKLHVGEILAFDLDQGEVG